MRAVPEVPDPSLEEAVKMSPTFRTWGGGATRGNPEIQDPGMEGWQGRPRSSGVRNSAQDPLSSGPAVAGGR